MIKVVSAAAENLYMGVKALIEEKLKLKPKSLSGLGTDVIWSFFSLSQVKSMQFWINIKKFIFHLLHLCVSAASKVLPTNLELLIRETHNWFNNCTLRREAYKQIRSDKEPKCIVELLATRWFSLCVVIERTLDQWLELNSHFKKAALTERFFTAITLAVIYEDETNCLSLTFLSSIVREFLGMNLIFQRTSAEPGKPFRDTGAFIATLFRRIVGSSENMSVSDLFEITLTEKNL